MARLLDLRTITPIVTCLTIACGGGGDGEGSGSNGQDDGVPITVTATVGDTGETEGDDNADGSAGDGVLDVNNVNDLPTGACGGDNGGGGGGGGNGDGELELSYIWIANTAQGTISKIDTQTMIEEGRYQAKPANGDPSRTSVNLQGDVAVANRNGGVAKFWANIEDCQDTNGIPGIQTSIGANDVLPWGEDECLAWYTDLTCSSNRPAAWTRGLWEESECAYTGADLWTTCDSDVMLLDGQTGAIKQTIPIEGTVFMYGGAADADSNFWGLNTSGQQLVRVDYQTFTYETYPLPPTGGYGITVGPQGRPWVCGGGGVSRFNLDTLTWDSAGGSGIGGCMTDGESLIWHSDNTGMLLGYDIETLMVAEQVQLPEYVHGVSVDFDGYVWGVSFAGSNAYRADPISDQVDTFDQLIGAYTYSDMTGFALSSAGGGGPPQG